MKKLIFGAIALITANLSTLSAASFTFYTNESVFLTALTSRPLFNETFGSPLPGGGTRLGTNNLSFSNGTFSFTANIPGDPALKSFWSDTFGSTRALSVGDFSDVFVFTNISPNTAAFGGYFFPTFYDPDTDGVLIDASGNMTISLLFGDSTPAGVTNAARGTTNINDWFFGWVTDEPGTAIQSVTMTAGINNSSAADVTLAVPEPSTYALLGLSAAILAWHLIRRRRA
jgi:hypothetical protein